MMSRIKYLRFLVHLKWFFIGESLILFDGEELCHRCSGSKYIIHHMGDDICHKCGGTGKTLVKK